MAQYNKTDGDGGFPAELDEPLRWRLLRRVHMYWSLWPLRAGISSGKPVRSKSPHRITTSG